jgi:hypothetical protein
MNTWIFQSNPKGFNLDIYLKQVNSVQWSIRQKQYKYQFSIGDDVYIWRADGFNPGSGGIIARGKIISLPELAKDKHPQYYITQQDNLLDLRVNISISEVRLSEVEGMIKRVDLEADERIEDLTILRMRNQTNYKLELKQAIFLKQLWDKKIK